MIKSGIANEPPKSITTEHTDNVPVGYADRAHELERCVCFEWVNVGGLVDESESFNVGYFSVLFIWNFILLFLGGQVSQILGVSHPIGRMVIGIM